MSDDTTKYLAPIWSYDDEDEPYCNTQPARPSYPLASVVWLIFRTVGLFVVMFGLGWGFTGHVWGGFGLVAVVVVGAVLRREG